MPTGGELSPYRNRRGPEVVPCPGGDNAACGEDLWVARPYDD